MAIDHVSVGVTNMKRSKAFYDAALAPLGMTPVMPVEIRGQLVGVGYGEKFPSFWIQLPINGQAASMGNGVHIAFNAKTREGVDAFYLAAMEHGGIDDGKPGLRTIITAPSSTIRMATRSRLLATPTSRRVLAGRRHPC
jgi:catechol 2,3-dioxygenase-like lactoylglutathione lyase family enzyme